MSSPISIPIPNMKHKECITSLNLSRTYPPSPSNSPKTANNIYKRVVLYGTPFKNKETVKMLLEDCVDELNDEEIKNIIDRSETNKEKGVTIIRTIDEHKANKYCQNLVENGLDATIE